MHVVLVSIGSMGDTFPFLEIGKEMLARGRRVTFMANGAYQEQIERAGLAFVEGLSKRDFLAYAEQQKDWTARESLRHMNDLMIGQAPRVYDFLAEIYRPGETVVVAQGYALGARVAQEKLGLPLATAHVQPLWFRSVYDAPNRPPWFPIWGVRVLDRLLDVAVDVGVGKPLNRFRDNLGLPPAKRIMKHWWNSPQKVLGLFPDWFNPPQEDWPPNTTLTGFVRSKPTDGVLDPELESFLAAGSPPVVFTQTSVSKEAHDFFGVSLDAAKALGRRAIFLTPHRNLLPASLPDSVRAYPFVPLDRLLPRAAAHVHHGGIGTIALTLAAGVPQLTVPMTADQPDNSLRLKKLGVSALVEGKSYDASRAAAAIQALLESKEVSAKCKDFAERMRHDDGVTVACAEIEKLAAAR